MAHEPRATPEEQRAKASENRFFADLNGKLKPIGFRLRLAEMLNPLNKGLEHTSAYLWPLPHLMIKGDWITRDGRHQRMNNRSFELVASDKRTFAAEALALAREHKASLIPNDGHPRNDARNYDHFEVYCGPTDHGKEQP